MKQLVIIGAGGMGRTIYDMARESVGYGSEFEIKGFVDDNIFALDGFENYPPIISTIKDCQPLPDEVYTFSIGGEARRTCIESLLARGAQFINIIHHTARIGSNVKIGTGNIIGAFTTLGADCSVGSYNMIQSYTVVGHDARVGDFNRIDTHVTCVGGVKIQDNVVVHTGAIINHGVVIESNSKAGAGSFVIMKVKEGTTVFGSPAKKLR